MTEVQTYHEDEETFTLEEGTCNCGVDIRIRPIIYVQIKWTWLIERWKTIKERLPPGTGILYMPACRGCQKLLPIEELL